MNFYRNQAKCTPSSLYPDLKDSRPSTGTFAKGRWELLAHSSHCKRHQAVSIVVSSSLPYLFFLTTN